MTKAQSFIVEFILFFMISFSLFSIISFYFYNQTQYFKHRIGESTSQLINDLLSTEIMSSFRCKACDSLSTQEDIPSRIGDYYYEIKLNDQGLNTNLLSEKPYSKQGTIFNLNETFTLSGESSSENKRIEIKINNVDKIIEVK